MKKEYYIAHYYDPNTGYFSFLGFHGKTLPPSKLKVSPIIPTTIQKIAHGPRRRFRSLDQRKNGWCFTNVPHLYDEDQAKKLMDRICADPWTTFFPVLCFHATKVRGLNNG